MTELECADSWPTQAACLEEKLPEIWWPSVGLSEHPLVTVACACTHARCGWEWARGALCPSSSSFGTAPASGPLPGTELGELDYSGSESRHMGKLVHRQSHLKSCGGMSEGRSTTTRSCWQDSATNSAVLRGLGALRSKVQSFAATSTQISYYWPPPFGAMPQLPHTYSEPATEMLPCSCNVP